MVDLHRSRSRMLMGSFSSTKRAVQTAPYRGSKDPPFEGEKFVSTQLTCSDRRKLTYSDLEVSKPQKNSRNAAATATGNNLRANHGRRSRSPDYDRGSRGTGGRPSIDRGVINGSIGNDIRRRDDYRPMRSPSPRGFRGRDEYRGRDRSPDRYYGSRRSRSRSPFGRNGRYRSRSPRGRDMDDEANLAIPRRNPRDVPEVQVILVDEVDR